MVECPICLRDVEIPADAAEGDIIVCPYCGEEIRLIRADGRWDAVRAA